MRCLPSQQRSNAVCFQYYADSPGQVRLRSGAASSGQRPCAAVPSLLPTPLSPRSTLLRGAGTHPNILHDSIVHTLAEATRITLCTCYAAAGGLRDTMISYRPNINTILLHSSDTPRSLLRGTIVNRTRYY